MAYVRAHKKPTIEWKNMTVYMFMPLSMRLVTETTAFIQEATKQNIMPNIWPLRLTPSLASSSSFYDIHIKARKHINMAITSSASNLSPRKQNAISVYQNGDVLWTMLSSPRGRSGNAKFSSKKLIYPDSHLMRPYLMVYLLHGKSLKGFVP